MVCKKPFTCTLEKLRKNIFYDNSILELDSVVLGVMNEELSQFNK